MDRSTFRESGSSDSHRPTPPGDFSGLSRRQALADLLQKHKEPDPTEHVPAHQFWRNMKTHTISGRQIMAQREHAAKVWERLHPGMPAHFEVDMGPIEARLFRHYAPWSLRVRMFLSRFFRVTAILVIGHSMTASRANACTVQVKQNEVTSAGCTASTPQDAAALMAKVDSPANVTNRDLSLVLPRGPNIVIMGYGGDRYETDFARAAYNAARDRWLSRYPVGDRGSAAWFRWSQNHDRNARAYNVVPFTAGHMRPR